MNNLKVLTELPEEQQHNSIEAEEEHEYYYKLWEDDRL
jgi:hypothetical protein